MQFSSILVSFPRILISRFSRACCRSFTQLPLDTAARAVILPPAFLKQSYLNQLAALPFFAGIVALPSPVVSILGVESPQRTSHGLKMQFSANFPATTLACRLCCSRQRGSRLMRSCCLEARGRSTHGTLRALTSLPSGTLSPSYPSRQRTQRGCEGLPRRMLHAATRHSRSTPCTSSSTWDRPAWTATPAWTRGRACLLGDKAFGAVLGHLTRRRQ